jgi:hypothetical protein
MPEIRLPRDQPPEDKPTPQPDVDTGWADRWIARRFEELEAESATPRADALRASRPDRFSPHAWDRICDGVAFDEIRARHYADLGGANEIALDNRKRLDSYITGEAIVSRKHTHLSEVQIETAIGYLREMDRKYNVDQTVADTPGNRAQLPEQIGRKLDGDLILEVPPQDGDVPVAVLEEAKRLGIRIRDTDGREYKLP